jgi:two-component sensor histidine kinase
VQLEPGGPLVERFVDFVYQPIRDASGAVSGIFVEGSDVTARKQVEDELRAANRQKDQFLAMLAHELRNPLAPIMTAAQLLKVGNLDPSSVANASEIIARQAAHMTDLVNDLLDVSRVTRGLVTLEKEELDLNVIVAAAVEQVRPLVDARRHSLTLQLSGRSAHVIGDRTRLVQVISNILNNAAKYTAPGGRITLAVTVTSSACMWRCATTASASRPTSCPTSSTCSPRPSAPRTVRRAGSGSAWPWSRAWWPCMAAPCAPPATAWRRAANSASACRAWRARTPDDDAASPACRRRAPCA